MTQNTCVLKRALILIISFALILTAVTVPAAAKSKVKLSKGKLTITSGKTAALKLSGTTAKANWSVSGEKLVAIKTSGKKRLKATIKAGKKTGVCYVKVKAGKKTLKCKVTVKATKKPDPEPKPSPDPAPVTEDEKKALVNTSLSMLKYLCANEKDKTRNVLISPDSILTAMAMVENGARNNTLKEMETAFGMTIDDLDELMKKLNDRLTSSKSIKYHIANSIWYKDNENDIKVNEDFIKKNLDYFGAEIYKAPFSNETIKAINTWVSKNTDEMIPKIIDEFNEDTVMVLINAIAFQGEWADQYTDNQISDQSFYNEDSTVQNKVRMLFGTEHTYVNIGGANGFIKPYAGGEIAFLGLETPENMTVDQFIQKLSAEDFVKGYSKRSGDYDVSTRMPEFKYDYDASLVDPLKSMGIMDAFNDFTADFSGITPPEQPVVISDVLHKTHIELDKNGTKAAAATAVIIDKASAAPIQRQKIKVTLDHPFVYAIIDTQSGIPLFIGTVKTVK